MDKIAYHGILPVFLYILHLYKLGSGYFLTDDTMRHHTKFCKRIHGVFVLSDHALGTNPGAVCIVFLYYTDGDDKKSVIGFRIPGKHRIVRSMNQNKQSIGYLLTNGLTWEATKIISVYKNRRIIGEFFRNAKQLTDTEGATVRSEQGVTLALCLVSWTDFLLRFENYKQRTAGELTKELSAIPSMVRQA